MLQNENKLFRKKKRLKIPLYHILSSMRASTGNACIPKQCECPAHGTRKSWHFLKRGIKMHSILRKSDRNKKMFST